MMFPLVVRKEEKWRKEGRKEGSDPDPKGERASRVCVIKLREEKNVTSRYIRFNFSFFAPLGRVSSIVVEGPIVLEGSPCE